MKLFKIISTVYNNHNIPVRQTNSEMCGFTNVALWTPCLNSLWDVHSKLKSGNIS